MKILSFDVKVYVLKDISTAQLMQKQCEPFDNR
ncbi:Uncharacterised protein [Acetobacterium wieringae]|nr:Uncharacterised protein [Acetobacterium wieringae]